MTAIDDKHRQLPFLGNPVDEGAGSAEMDLRDGRGRFNHRFEGGEIRWTPTGGPKAILNSGFGDDLELGPADN